MLVDPEQALIRAQHDPGKQCLAATPAPPGLLQPLVYATISGKMTISKLSSENLMQLPASRPLASRCSALLAGVAVLAALSGCGYKGPLYLPPPEEPPADLTVPPTSAATSDLTTDPASTSGATGRSSDTPHGIPVN